MVNDASMKDYQQLQQSIGTERTVVVQPRIHGTDNSVTLAAIKAAIGFEMAEPLAHRINALNGTFNCTGHLTKSQSMPPC